MPFIARIEFLGAEPLIRGYLHSCGAEVFGEGEAAVKEAAEYAVEMWKKNDFLVPEDTVYAFAALFGQRGDRMVELFGYSDFQETSTSRGNPTKSRWTYQNGIYIQPMEDGCEDTDILLAEEALWRRHVGTKSFLSSGPEIRESILIPGNRYLAVVRRPGVEVIGYSE